MAATPEHHHGPHRRVATWAITGLAACVVAAGALGIEMSAGKGGGAPSPRPVTAAAAPAPAVVPLSVVATAPSNGASDVASNQVITVSLSTALSPSSPAPSLTPPVAGSWAFAGGSELAFEAEASLVPGTAETLTVPGGPGGLVAVDGARMGTSLVVRFSVATGSTLRLQQLLAELGYLPVSFQARTSPTAPQDEAVAQTGTFAWRWSGLPGFLTSLWSPGTYGVLTRGAVMRFETVQGLATDGSAGPDVWAALLRAVATDEVDPQPYDYVYVSTTVPETVTVYETGTAVYETLCNTGVAAMPTTAGTYPVFARYVVTTMVGTNPTGSHYVDPGIPWVSYFHGGDALHGYVRAGYGFPQSDGCVEMPPANAEVVFPLTPIGTLVTVE